VAGNWGQRDEQSARLWIFGLADGPVRDAALRGFIGEVYRDSLPESSLLALFDSEQAKQQSIAQLIYRIGADKPDEARRLLDEQISLPEVRRQAEQWLEQRQGSDQSFVIYPGGVILSN
jgi:hypothetical protein